MINIFRLVFLVVCGFSLGIPWVYASKEAEPDFLVNNEWGKPVFEQYTPPNTASEWMWRYTRKNATLIMTRSECEKCKPVTQQDVDEYNSREAQITGRSSALLLDFKGTPAMLRISTNRKNMNFHVFQIYTNGFYYKLHLGVNTSTTHEFSFQLEHEFMGMINGFVPQY